MALGQIGAFSSNSFATNAFSNASSNFSIDNNTANQALQAKGQGFTRSQALNFASSQAADEASQGLQIAQNATDQGSQGLNIASNNGGSRGFSIAAQQEGTGTLFDAFA